MFSYGGWLDWSGFFVEGQPITSGNARDVALYYGVSFGIRSNSLPTGGSASWNGVMVATDISGAGREHIFQGDADLSINFASPTLGCPSPPCVDLSFSNVWGTDGTRRRGTTWSDMPVTRPSDPPLGRKGTPADRWGEFSGTNAQGETAGRFYGPAHEEAGGTFNYDDLVGAYGLKRQ